MAFSFCWWAHGHLPASLEQPDETGNDPPSEQGKGEKGGRDILAGGLEGGEGVVGAMDNTKEIMEGVLRDAPPVELRALLEKVFSGEGLYPYVH